MLRWGGLKGEGAEKGFLKQVNDELVRTGHNAAFDASNYLASVKIQEIRKFYMENFRLFTKDEYGNLFIHGFLPVDDEGDVCIGRMGKNGKVTDKDENGKNIKGLWYKGEQYTGSKLFEGFEKISSDIRNY